jgi:integrase
MPIYKGRRPGTWRVTAYSHGQQHEELVEGSKAEATRREAELRLELGALSCSRVRAGLTLSQLCKGSYNAHAKRRLGAETCRVRAFHVASLLEQLGSVKLASLTTAHVEAYQDARLDDGLMASSINNELRVLKTILRWAASQGHVVGQAEIKRLKQIKSRVRAYSEDEVQALFAAARDVAPYFVPILIFLVNTGMRRGEAIAARWEWINWRLDRIEVPCTRFWHPKDGEPRDVPMADAVRAILSPRKTHGPLFANRSGHRYACWPKDMWERTRDEAGVPGGVHQLRHTFASHFLANEPDMGTLAEILGHSSTRTTELYAHMLPGRFDRAKNAVNIAPRLVVAEPKLWRDSG